MATVHTVKAARQDHPEYGIKKGETYYYWFNRETGKHVSKLYPTEAEQTRESFMLEVGYLRNALEYLLESQINIYEFKKKMGALRSDVIQLKQWCQHLLHSALPEHKKLYKDRFELLEQVANDIWEVDLDYNEPSENDFADERQGGEDFEEFLDRKLSEWFEEKREELRNINFE